MTDPTHTIKDLSDFPSNARSRAVGFSINGLGYVGLREDYSNFYQDKTMIGFLQEKGIPGIFNACEAGVWFVLAGVFYFLTQF